MTSFTSLDIIVVGAGPVGLAAAAALAQDGHSVTVLERHPQLQARGGNFIVQSPAVKCLNSIGLAGDLEAISFETHIHKLWSYKSDQPFKDSEATPEPGNRRCTERPALQKITYEAAIKLGVRVVFNQRVVAADLKAGRPCISTIDGSQYEADLVVGADGIKSVMRRLLFPDDDLKPVLTPECIFQTEVNRNSVGNDPVAHPLSSPTHHLVFGPSRYCVGRPTTHGTMRMLLCHFNYGVPGSDDDIDGTWNSNGDPTEIKELFKDFNAPLRAYIECVVRDGHPIDKWRIATAPQMKTWIGLAGRGLIIGDAAHAMVPHNAQGVSQGIEDGFSLSTALRWAKSSEDIPQLLQWWEVIRKPRAEKMYDISNDRVTMFSLPDGPAQEARDEQLRQGGLIGEVVDWSTVKADMNAHPHTPAFTKWQYLYDVVEETNNFIQQQQPL